MRTSVHDLTGMAQGGEWFVHVNSTKKFQRGDRHSLFTPRKSENEKEQKTD